MPSPTLLSSTLASRSGRLLRGTLALSLLSTVTLLSPPAAVADEPVSPAGGSFTVRGSGFGHGHGMSQYGAYGAAKKGLGWKEILAFYYPGTTLTTMPTRSTIKVWLTADTDGDLRVEPAAGLSVTDGDGHRFVLPTGADHTGWRITRSGSGYRLSHRTAAGTYATTSAPGLTDSTWSFTATGQVLTLVLPSGSTRPYRGSLALVRRGTGARTVNTVRLEDYVRAVVPSEMPTSWLPDAVRVQAVAARSYAVRLRDTTSYDGYDICDTTACQVYGGQAREDARGDAAVAATAGTVVSHRGAVALTQFASSNGGALAASTLPYLVAKPDPYDGVVSSQAWTRTVSAAAIAAAWPSVGAVRTLRVTARDGSGPWGGRVRTLVITGSRGTVTGAGSTFQSRVGTRSSLYTVGGDAVGDSTRTPVLVPPGKAWATFPRSFRSTSAVDVTVVSGDLLRRYPVVEGVLRAPVTLGAGFARADQVMAVGDWDGDGYQDVASRAVDGALTLHRGSSSGKLRAGVAMGFGTGLRTVAGIGDVDGDRHPDLAVISRAGNLWLYHGDGSTGRSTRVLVDRGWQDQDALRAPGDVTGDGRPDLLALDGDRLWLHPGRADGFAARVSLGTGWSRWAALTAVGDVDGDGRGDLLARTSSGALRIFRGDGRGGFGRAAALPGSYTGTRFVV